MSKLTATQYDVLNLIANNRELGDYVPRYVGRRGRGAFPVTIAGRAAVQLRKLGLVTHNGRSWIITDNGRKLLRYLNQIN